MSDFDHIAFGKQMGEFVQDELRPIRAELEAIKSAEPIKGEPGKDADPVDLEALADMVVAKLLASDRVDTLIDLAVTDSVAKHFEANPVRDGKDCDPAEVRKMVEDAVAAIPAPKDGKDAEPISDERIAAEVEKHLTKNPPKDGADGVGLAGAMIDRTGSLIVTTTKGEFVSLGRVVGEDGKDGFDFDDVSGEYVAEKGFVLTLSKGSRKAEFVLPYMAHKGFWREGMGVKAAESITHDGALWIAKRDNASKPCMENSEDWALAARKGRDGRDGKIVEVERSPVKLGAGNAA